MSFEGIGYVVLEVSDTKLARHNTNVEAVLEAQRLAQICPDKHFIVLKPVSEHYVSTNPVSYNVLI